MAEEKQEHRPRMQDQAAARVGRSVVAVIARAQRAAWSASRRRPRWSA